MQRNRKFAIKLFEMLCNNSKFQENNEMEMKEENDKEIDINSLSMSFDDFLVGIAICFCNDLVSDAFALFFKICDRHCRGFINKYDLKRTIKWIERGLFAFCFVFAFVCGSVW